MKSDGGQRLFSGCKINLFLRVGPRLPSGLHRIESLFLPLELPGDCLEIRPADRGDAPPLTRFFDERGAPLDDIDPESNTLTKAWTWFRALCGLAPALELELRKGVPHGSGLGGGSANAAALLLFLRDLAEKRGLPLPDLETFARQSAAVGADVPFFILNRPALVRGVGEILSPCANPFAGHYLLLVCPKTRVNTGWAFAELDRWREQGGARPCPSGTRIGPRRPNGPPPFGKPARRIMPLDPHFANAEGRAQSPEQNFEQDQARDFGNDFEAPIFKRLPELAALHAELAASGALLARMSGSGAALFAIYREKKNAGKMVKALADRGLRVYMQPLPKR